MLRSRRFAAARRESFDFLSLAQQALNRQIIFGFCSRAGNYVECFKETPKEDAKAQA